MADDQESSDDERAVELSAISYIFPELIVDPSDPFTASLEIAVTPAKPLSVEFPALVAEGLPPTPPRSVDNVDGDNTTAPIVETQTRALSHLPSLRLQIKLPEGYPSTKAPDIKLSCDGGYLLEEKLKDLENKAHTLWNDNGQSEVLYDYIDFLQQATENAFGLSIDEKAVKLPQDLELGLLDFDLKAKKAKFDQETFDCGVCLEPKKGAVCHKLVLCGHVFCRECLQDFYNNCITEGDVTNVKCLTPKCEEEIEAGHQPVTQRKKRRKKVDRTLNPSELLEIPMSQEQVQRYVQLKRKKELEADKNTVYCPRKWCQSAARPKKTTPVMADAEDESSESETEDAQDPEQTAAETEKTSILKLPPMSERLSICSSCSYAFCSVCRKSWHGELQHCLPPRAASELTKEEKATEDYLLLHSTRCPTCDSRCQKSRGCNHMRCFMCESHFCYLCSAWLDEANPYTHFNTSGTRCYQRLWEMEEGDEATDNNARDGPNAAPQNQDAQPPDVHEVHIEEPPPPAPVAPRPAGGAVHAPPWEVPPGIRVNRRAQQGLARRAPAAAAGHARQEANPQNGLQRFLAMVQDDREDEWDSDELDSDDDFEIPIRVR